MSFIFFSGISLSKVSLTQTRSTWEIWGFSPPPHSPPSSPPPSQIFKPKNIVKIELLTKYSLVCSKLSFRTSESLKVLIFPCETPVGILRTALQEKLIRDLNPLSARCLWEKWCYHPANSSCSNISNIIRATSCENIYL